MENNDKKIIMEHDPDGEAENGELVRVDSIEEAEEKRQQEEERAEAEEELRRPELERQEEELGYDPAGEEQTDEEEQEQQEPTANENSLRMEYIEKANNLEDEMSREAAELPEGAETRGFHLSYHGVYCVLL